MAFTIFFLASSALMLVATLFVMRSRDPRLRPFGVAATATAVLLLAGAVLRLTDRVGLEAGGALLVDAVTVANLTASVIMLMVWTTRLPRGPG